jgi:hypothetical protein
MPAGGAAGEDDGMNLLDRIRRVWGPQPQPDHPLTEDERRPERELGAEDAAHTWSGVYGRTLREPVDSD